MKWKQSRTATKSTTNLNHFITTKIKEQQKILDAENKRQNRPQQNWEGFRISPSFHLDINDGPTALQLSVPYWNNIAKKDKPRPYYINYIFQRDPNIPNQTWDGRSQGKHRLQLL